MKWFKTVLATLVVAGCTSTSGIQISEDQLAELKQSKATIQTVTARFGQPNSSHLMPNGQRILTYAYSAVRTDAKAFVPVVGPLMGGSGYSISTASLTFSQDGVLESYSTSQSNHQSGSTMSTGTGK